MLQSLLDLDRSLLISAHGLLSPNYTHIVQYLGELVVLWGAGILLVLWFDGLKYKDLERKKNALRIFFTIISVFLLYTVINFGIPQWRPTPQSVTAGIGSIIPHPNDNSFPSGHALFSIALIVGLWQYYRKSWLITTTSLIALVTLVSRVVGGTHYPGDIIGGLVLGGIAAILLAPLVTSKWMEEKVYPWLIQIAGYMKL